MRNLIKFKIIIFLSLLGQNSFAFDLEDYATTYRATKDAYNKAYNEFILAQKYFLQVVKFNRRLMFTPTADAATMGNKINSCDTIFEASKMRDKSKVLPEMTEIVNNSTVRKFADDETVLDGILADTTYYYTRFDPSLIETEKVLFEVESYIPDRSASGYNVTPQFDLEDYQSTFRANRDAYFKALNEFKLASAPYFAAKEAYAAAYKYYLNYENCADYGFAKNMEDNVEAGALD
jgi:hypothetical protein